MIVVRVELLEQSHQTKESTTATKKKNQPENLILLDLALDVGANMKEITNRLLKITPPKTAMKSRFLHLESSGVHDVLLLIVRERSNTK